MFCVYIVDDVVPEKEAFAFVFAKDGTVVMVAFAEGIA